MAWGYLLLFVCLLSILLAVKSKKLFLFVFVANMIMGDFLYLSPTLYGLPHQQEISFTFTDISLLVCILFSFVVAEFHETIFESYK